MTEAFVIVYNEGNDRTSYVQEVNSGVLDHEAVTVPTVTQATLYDTWGEAMNKIIAIRKELEGLNLNIEMPMMFPMGVDKKALFKAKLKYGE